MTDARPPQPTAYPISLKIEYQEELSRLSTFFRLILLIPLAIFVAIIAGSVDGDAVGDGATYTLGTMGGLVLAYWIVIFLRQRPVNWLFDVIVHIQRFTLRATAYFFLLADKYPPFEGDWLLVSKRSTKCVTVPSPYHGLSIIRCHPRCSEMIKMQIRERLTRVNLHNRQVIQPDIIAN